MFKSETLVRAALILWTVLAGAIQSFGQITCTSAPPGIVSWWAGDNTAKDLTGGNNGTFVTNATYAPGEVGTGFSFDGTGNYIQIPDSPNLSFTNDFTIEFWYKDTGLPGGAYGGIIAKRPVSPIHAPCNYGLTIMGGNPATFIIYFLDSNSGNYQVLSYQGLPPAGTFHHLAVGFHQLPADQVQIRVYVDGQFVALQSFPGNLSRTINNAPVTIGASNASGEFFKGILDEISIYKRLLSDSEINGIYTAGAAGKCLDTPPVVLVQPTNQTVLVGATVTLNVVAAGAQPLSYQWSKDGSPLSAETNSVLTLKSAQLDQSGTYSVLITNSLGSVTSSNALITINLSPPCAPPPAGLVAWWSAEGSANDEIGVNNGTVLGTLTYGAGKVGSAFDFDGTTTAIVAPASPTLTDQSLTIEAWIFPTDLSIPRPIVEYGDSTGDISPLHFWYSWDGGGVSPGCLYAIVRGPSRGTPYILVGSAGGLIPANQWSHVAVSFDYTNRSVVLYVNGVSVGSGSSPVTVTPPLNVPVNLGYRPVGSGDLWGGRRHIGGLDEVSIYNRALSAAEIQAVYQSGAAGKCKAPTAPFVIVPPTNQTVIVGSTATFSVLASGTQPLSYQWSLAGTVLAGATNPVLVLGNVQPSQAGEYSVQITNVVGSITVSNAVLTVNPPPPCTPPPAGLVSWWQAQSNVVDFVGANNGLSQTNVGFAPGKVGTAFSFDGGSGKVDLGDPQSLAFTNSFSIEGWIWVNGLPPGSQGLGQILYRGDPRYCLDPYYLATTTGGSLRFHVEDAQDSIPCGMNLETGAFPLHQWHHVAATFDGQNGTMQIFTNGQLAAQTTTSVRPFQNLAGGGASIGNLSVGQNGQTFNGLIDELAVYNRRLTAAEILALYQADAAGKCTAPSPPVVVVPPTNQTLIVGSTATFLVVASGTQPLSYQWSLAGTALAGATSPVLVLGNVQPSQAGEYSVQITNIVGSITVSNAVLTVNPPPPCTPPPSGLISWWQAEGDVLDSVGGNNGSLTNGATFATGEDGQGFSFDGVHSYVEIPDSPSLSFTNDFSIELWYKDTGLAPGAYGGLIAKRPYPILPCNFGITIIGGSPSTLLVYFLDPNYNFGDYQGMYYYNVPAAGVFHHLAATYQQMPAEQIQIKAYIDGQLVQTQTFQGNLARTVGHSPVDIGASNFSGEFFKGIIDEVSIYSKLLSDTEIASIYASASKGKCATPIPAHVAVQPSGQSVVLGQTATLTANGAGTSPLSYQWFFKGGVIPDATNAVLTLTNVQLSQAGDYSFEVTNAYGSALSSNATLVVNFPPATVQAISVPGTAGQLVTVPVVLLANGNENAVGFSLNFPPNKLAIAGVVLGTGATNASLQFNTNQSGSVGVAIGLPSGATFAAGTQEVAEVTFSTAGSFNLISVVLNFGDVPTKRELSDIKANQLAVNFLGGQIQLARSLFEADVAPRPGGDGSVTIVDWVQVGRYVAALDSPTNASEFQRADCAPRTTLGDGALTVSDWVQAGRYAAGLEPLTASGGPTQPTSGNVVSGAARKKGTDPARVLSVQGPLLFQGQTATATVVLEAQGNENAIGLSLGFDPATVAYTSAALGPDASNATMDINANLATNGHVGIILALPTNVGFSPGTRQVLKVNFQAVTASPADATLALTDSPVLREVADTNALPVVASYLSGVISVNPKPSLAIAHANQNISLLWPLWATNYNLQQAVGNALSTSSWTNVPVSPVLTNNNFDVILPLSGSSQFYRLQHN